MKVIYQGSHKGKKFSWDEKTQKQLLRRFNPRNIEDNYIRIPCPLCENHIICWNCPLDKFRGHELEGCFNLLYDLSLSHSSVFLYSEWIKINNLIKGKKELLAIRKWLRGLKRKECFAKDATGK